jgi:RimJ/RimL family protein N-acetyltransferase
MPKIGRQQRDTRGVLTDVWPLFGLVLRTSRLELRLPSLEQLTALAELADEGVHDRAAMPFLMPWTDLPPGPRGRSVMQHQWRLWGELTPQRWSLDFAVVVGGEPVGVQGVGGTEFAVTREVHTGSWLGLRHQGRGIGTEMRAAVLHLAFDGLGADSAVSSALVDNLASVGVSRKLGYADDGIEVQAVRGQRRTDQRFRIDRASWAARRSVPVRIEGLEPCRELLGAVSSGVAANAAGGA